MRPEAHAVVLALFTWLPAVGFAAPAYETDADSGLVLAPGWALVRANCDGCHAVQLVIQNRGDRAHWKKLVRWMQAEHNLWNLGPVEDRLLDYLAEYYSAPDTIPRRQPLETHPLEPPRE